MFTPLFIAFAVVFSLCLGHVLMFDPIAIAIVVATAYAIYRIAG